MSDKENIEAYVVGGYVRDKLLGNQPSDKDFVVVGETPESMEERGFKPIDATQFPVFLDEARNEWALARTERSDGNSYHDFETFTDNVTIEEDLERRDLTVNSMAVPIGEDIEMVNIITPNNHTNPIYDLRNRILRHTSDAFGEDPVRSLRLARFSGRYPSFRIHPSTLEVAQEAAHRLSEQPNERIGKEFKKAFSECKSVRRFLEILNTANILEKIDDNLALMKHTDAGNTGKYHKEGNLWQHTLMVVEEMQKIRENDPHALLMALVHDIGKIKNTKGHANLGVDIAEEFVRESLKLPNGYVKAAKEASREHMRIHKVPNSSNNTMKSGKVIDMVNNVQYLGRMIDLAKADARGRIPYQTIDEAGMRERIEKAREAVNNVDADYVVSKRDSSIDDYSGEAIGSMIKEDRIEYMEEL
jgi:tRNA nucleotidyltransferase (CCA-adding enzyme)